MIFFAPLLPLAGSRSAAAGGRPRRLPRLVAVRTLAPRAGRSGFAGAATGVSSDARMREIGGKNRASSVLRLAFAGRLDVASSRRSAKRSPLRGAGGRTAFGAGFAELPRVSCRLSLAVAGRADGFRLRLGLFRGSRAVFVAAGLRIRSGGSLDRSCERRGFARCGLAGRLCWHSCF